MAEEEKKDITKYGNGKDGDEKKKSKTKEKYTEDEELKETKLE